ncbi:NUDIX hydrolase [Catelliglobosispora koreensis]|uniref:NUDIX hydrolase n=1 Tax=Catelliglobosispora koreensis TaxID=129052 RepID=UPI0003A5D1A3|nr:NUDIX hydrolase [Catelliglobosispora koreensis]
MWNDAISQRLKEMAREFAASGREPAVPRSAATVVLLRPDRSVFLIRRLRAMAFGGMWAFPGGAFEPGETPVQAAVRELFEETGVPVEPADLVPWHRWLTPVFEPKRFDTWFYLAALPQGHEPILPEGEADRVQWLTPEQAMAEHMAGNLPMLPPTLVTLTELSSYDNVDAMLAQVRDISEPFMPEFPVD